MKQIVQWIGCWLLVLSSVGAWGQVNLDWRSEATNGNWNEANNWWNGSTTQSPPGGDRLRFNNNIQTAMNNNTSNTNRFQIIFQSGATTSRSVGGTNNNSFFDFGGTWPRIENQSTGTHSLGFPITIGAGGTWNMETVASTGPLVFTNTISHNTSKTLFIWGNNTAVNATNRYVRFSGEISGNGTLNVSQFGVARLAANQTYTGQTQIDNGELWIESGGDISGGGGIFVGNTGQPGNVAKLWLSNPTGGTAFSRPITINQGDATTREIGGLNTSGTHTFSGNVTNNSTNGLVITALNSGSTLNVSGDISVTGNPATFGGNGNINLTGRILSGSGGTLIKNGLGVLTASGASDFSGITTINAGTFRLGSAGLTGPIRTPLGNSTNRTQVNNGAVLDLNGFSIVSSEDLTLNGTGISSGGALTNSSATATNWIGILTLGSAATIVANNGAINLTNTGSAGGSGAFTLTLAGSTGGSLAHNMLAAGSVGAITKEGSGTWTLSGASTYTGATTINAGTLRISGGNNRLPIATAVSIASGATFDLNNQNQQIGSLASTTTGGSVTLGSGTLTIGGAATTTFSGAISGSGGLTKQGTGLQTLSGNNTYGGATTINAGDLIYNSAGALPNASNIVLAGGRMVMANTIPTAAFTPGTLTLGGTTNSEIVLGTSANAVTITFANSSAIGWIAGRRITIRNWSPTGNKNIFFIGSGLTADQLDVIDFDGYGLGAKFDGTTGRIIPRFIYVTQASGSGNFSAPASWLNNDNPTLTSCASNPATIVIQTGFTLTQDIAYDLTRIENSGTYLSNNVIITLCAGGSFVNNGVVNFTTAGGGSLVCSGTATFSGTASSASFALNNLTLNGVTTLTTAPTIRGTLQLNAGGTVSAAPVYANTSTLVYNQGGTIAIGPEWAVGNGSSIGVGLPQNVTIQNSTTTDLPASNRGCAGNLLISSGNLRLSTTTGFDLYVAGNFTNSGTFTHNDRALFMVGGTMQNLNGTLNATGATNCLPFLLIDKSGGTVRLNTPVNVTNTLTLTNGTLTLSNFNLTITSGNAIAGGTFGTTRMIVTNSIGQLVFGIPNDGANSDLFPIGDGTNYTPITINITGSTGTNRTIGMRVVDAAVPNPPLNTPTAPIHYITRYWIPSSSGFTSISWNGTATYAAAGDVVGTAANIRFSVWHPAPENSWMDYGGAPSGQTLTGSTNITDPNSLSTTAYITGRETAPKLFYRSIASGSWSDIATWQTATDAAFSNLVTPTLVGPSAMNSSGITIQNGHIITMDQNVILDQTIVQPTAVLRKGNVDLTISDGSGTDLIIQGRFEYNGGITGSLTIFNGTVLVESNALVQINSSTGSPSNYGTSNRITYQNGSVFQWNNSLAFLSSGVIYFVNSADGVIPTFLITANLGNIGGTGDLTINGLFQTDNSLTLENSGNKIFRNGITGAGIITQSANSGIIRINGTTSVLGGSGTISLNTAGLQITAGTCTMTSGKPIAGSGTFTVNNGATLNAGTHALSGSAPFTLAAGGTLVSASPTGVNGNITTSGTRTFTAGANYTFNGTAAQTTGNLMGTTIGTFTINNPTTVTLTNSNHVASTLNLQAGTFRAGIGTTLQIAAGGTVNGTGGNVSTNSNGEGGTIEFLANGAVNGTPTLWNVTIGNSGGGVNFANNATIFNRFTINAAGAVNPNAPTYANGSTLVYNTGGTYSRSVEWGQATAGAAGFPWHVEVMGSTIVNTGTVVPPRLAISGDLTIGAATNNNELRMNSLAIPLEVSGNLTIGSSTSQGNRLTLSDAPGGDLILQGNFTRFRSLNFFDNEAYTGNRGRRIIFSGSTPSSIDVVDATPANRVQAFHHMVMNKTGGARVNVQVPLLMIEDALTFNPNGGIINTRYNFGPGSGDAPGLLVMRRPATVQGTPSSTAMVNGMMRKETRLSSLTGGPSAMNGTFSGDFTFPIGKTNPSVLFRPVQIADVAHGSVDTWYDAEFALEPTTDAPRSAFFLDFVQGIWANNRWEVSRGGGDGSSLARVGIFYQTAFDNWTPVFPQPNSAVAVATYQLGGWRFTKLVENFNDAFPPYLEAVPEISPGAWVYSEPLSTFSPFSIGWAFWQLLPLPVTLHSFTATLQGGDGLLRWEIDDAKDLRHFELQHSTDGQRFATLATLPRQEATGYSYRHRMLSAGVHHYRLAIVEKDGRRHYSRIEMLQVGTQRTLISGLLHNPVVGGQAIVRLQSATAQSAQAVVIDMAGRVLLRQQVQLMAGANQVPLSMLPLPAGHYRLLFRTADGVEKVMPLLR